MYLFKEIILLTIIRISICTLTLSTMPSQVNPGDSFTLSCYVSPLTDTVAFSLVSVLKAQCVGPVPGVAPGTCTGSGTIAQDIVTEVTTLTITNSATSDYGVWKCTHLSEEATITITEKVETTDSNDGLTVSEIVGIIVGVIFLIWSCSQIGCLVRHKQKMEKNRRKLQMEIIKAIKSKLPARMTLTEILSSFATNSDAVLRELNFLIKEGRISKTVTSEPVYGYMLEDIKSELLLPVKLLKIIDSEFPRGMDLKNLARSVNEDPEVVLDTLNRLTKINKIVETEDGFSLTKTDQQIKQTPQESEQPGFRTDERLSAILHSAYPKVLTEEDLDMILKSPDVEKAVQRLKLNKIEGIRNVFEYTVNDTQETN